MVYEHLGPKNAGAGSRLILQGVDPTNTLPSVESLLRAQDYIITVLSGKSGLPFPDPGEPGDAVGQRKRGKRQAGIGCRPGSASLYPPTTSSCTSSLPRVALE